MGMSVRSWLLVGSALVSSGFGAPPASAQRQAQGSAAAGLEEIVVTARRKEEKLQTVPLAISAISGDQLAEHSIANAVDLGKLIPALNTAQTNRDLEGYEIRGLSNNNASAQGQSPTITPYFAEIPFPIGDGGGPGRFYDLENIQVLKGPQGTLFGRNSTGGAVLLQPRKPDDDFDGYAQLQFGNYDDREFQGAINVPIVSEKVLARFAGARAERDGFTKDVLNGKDLDNRDYWSGRFSLILRPTDDFENYFVVDSLYSDTNGSSEILAALDPGLQLSTIAGLPLFLGGNGPSPSALAVNPAAAFAAARRAGGFAFFPLSTLSRILARQGALGPRAVAIGNNPIEKIWSWGLADIARWDLSDELTLRNLFGYREFKQLTRYDDDGTSLPLLGPVTRSGWVADLGQYTEELQLQGKSFDDSLSWVAGTFGLFSHAIGRSENVSTAFGSTTTSAVRPTSRSEAVYAQATYDLGHSLDALHGLKFTAGYRFTWDYRALDLYQRNANGACSAPGADRNCIVSVSANGSQPSWTVGLDYRLTPNTLLYVTRRRGFRAGGLNSQSLIASQIQFKPETVEDVEIGVKSDWEIAGMKARTNLAAYHSDYANKQASQAYTATINGSVVTTNLIVNAGNATIEGVEADLTLIPIDDLELTASWAYNEAKFDRYRIVATGQTVAGQTYPYLPLNKVSLNGRYRLPAPEGTGELFLAATFSYQSHQYLGTFPTDPPYATIGGSYSTLDLALDWNNLLTYPLDLSLFATNVTDTIYRIGGYPIYGVAGFASFVYGEPRMYGARIRYRW
jgi:iron complex outermembrane receptor protein